MMAPSVLRRAGFGAWLGLALLPGAAAAQAPSVAVAPFLWAPSLKGQMSDGPVTIPLDASPGDLAGGIRSGGMLHAEISTRRLHASIQTIYADFHDRQFAPVLGADVRSNLFTVEALAGPVVEAGPVELSPMAGLRHTRIKGVFDAPGMGRLKAGHEWREMLVGLEAKAPVTDSLALRARATVAIDGPRGQDSSDLILAGSYRLSRTVSLAAGYRWASERVHSRRPGSFGMDLDAKGPLLGLVIGL